MNDQLLSFQQRAPEIVYKHVDGPYLICRDSSLRWLTLWERCLVFLKMANASTLDKTPWKVHDNTDLRLLLNKATIKAHQ